MRILITGSEGFVASNLALRLRELGHEDLSGIARSTRPEQGRAAIRAADFIYHLAGVNRPPHPDGYAENASMTDWLCRELLEAGRATPIIYSSSVHVARDDAYGRSKAQAEQRLERYAAESGADVRSLRLRSIFGKWSRPDYNSVVSTFCHRVTRDLPLRIDDPAATLMLVYIDDVVEGLIGYLRSFQEGDAAMARVPEYRTSVGELAATLQAFRESRDSLRLGRVGDGFLRALYATYVSYLPTDRFDYPVAQYADPRGRFIEMLKTTDSGQFSFFTAVPGATRGGHYHHTKTEKFLVMRGRARFRFRHMRSGERFELETRGEEPRIVETIPGWAHDITNIGEEEMLVLLWANEVFDRASPDTYREPL